MKFKLDENIGKRGLAALITGGHDVATIREEGLQGAEDEALLRVCVAEGRALITLDHDFGNVVRFPPGATPGIAVLELPQRATRASLDQRIR